MSVSDDADDGGGYILNIVINKTQQSTMIERPKCDLM